LSAKADALEIASKRKRKVFKRKKSGAKEQVAASAQTLKKSTLPLPILRQTPTTSTLLKVPFWIPELLIRLLEKKV
jgi:hypothetical protein